MVDYTQNSKKEENLITQLIYQYLPFWPLFAMVTVLCLFGVWVYLQYATPVYEISATLIIKDENKGVDDSKMMESINTFDSKKIVENEIEVIQSRNLMRQVVDDLHLYAPIYEDKKIGSPSAYLSSPIVVKVKDVDKFPELEEDVKIYFTFDTVKNEVIIHGKHYALNTWVTTPYGMLLFSQNSLRQIDAKNPLYFSLVHPKIITNELLGNLEISASNKLSTIVNLVFQDHVPQRGEDILNRLIYTYNQTAINEKNELAANTLSFIEERMKSVENELGALEKEVEKYKSSRGVVDLSEQGKLYLQHVGNYDRQIADINLQMAVLENVEQYVISKNKKSGIVPATLGINDAVLSQLLEKLYNAEMEYEKLSKTTAANNPILVAVANEIEQIRPGILENVKNQQVNLQASLHNLTNNTDKFHSALQTIPEKERELLEINRRKTIKNDLFSFLLQKREETALIYVPNAGDSRVVDMAESSIWPIYPKPLISYAIGIVISLVAVFVFITGKEILNQKILFRSDIEDLTNISVVGEISDIKKEQEKITYNKTEYNYYDEQFSQLCIAAGLYRGKAILNKIMVTSSISGEGKSFISSNLAISLAKSGKSVVLLDLDFRNPKTSGLFDVIGQKGIKDYLLGESESYEIIKGTDSTNLYVIPAGGKSYKNSTELLLNNRFEELLCQLEKDFDFILIDTPPIDLISDAYLVSKLCDLTLFVIRHDYTPKLIVQRLDKNTKSKSLKNINIVFNGIKPRGFGTAENRYGYGYETYTSKKYI